MTLPLMANETRGELVGAAIRDKRPLAQLLRERQQRLLVAVDPPCRFLFRNVPALHDSRHTDGGRLPGRRL